MKSGKLYKKDIRQTQGFNIAIAGYGPLLSRVWQITTAEHFKKAMPKVKITAFLRQKQQENYPAGLPVYSNPAELFSAHPDLGLVMDIDESGTYYNALRREAPANVNILNAQAVNFICNAMEHGQLMLDGAIRLLRMRKSFSTVINNLNYDVLILDANGIIIEVNNFFLKRTGKKRSAFIGKACQQIKGAELCCDNENTECPWQKAVQNKSKYSALYSRVEDNTLQYFKVEVFPLPGDIGQTSYLLIREDITESFHLQQRLQQSEKMAAIGELSTYIAHEIRNPLFAIGGFANALLRNNSLDASGREKASIILEESQRLDGILKSILNFSKPVTSEFGPFDLVQVTADTVKIMSMGDDTRKIETRFSTKPGLPYAHGNAGLVKQCLINIIKNAQEAMPEGGIISISVRKTGTKLELAVQDTGIGIEPIALNQIFNPFFSTKNKGAGLGLAMTKKLIEDMGGALEITSEVGKGTLVRVLLLPALAVPEIAPKNKP
ncbi:PAS domain-containing protein [Desulfovibrio sp. OttesenSCG-928-F07]|nr:PAS domain-containing protein [Desulfovibrio sp. OttesenSCG-928-F07]